MNVFLPAHHDSNGTAKICYLASRVSTTFDWNAWLATVRPEHMDDSFGTGSTGNDIDYKGYNDEEWYFRSADGTATFGIGWRWGTTRLRGKGNLTEENTLGFLNWLRRTLENTETIFRENV